MMAETIKGRVLVRCRIISAALLFPQFMPSINMKGGSASNLWSVLLLAVCILWTFKQSQSACREEFKFDFPRVRYTLDVSNREAYREMIAQLRELLTRHREYRQGILMLREPRFVPDNERYILLEISVLGQSPVTFAIDVTNVYIVGYLIGNTRYFFQEAPANADGLLFTDATVTSQPRRSSNYAKLEKEAKASREQINLGLFNLNHAIRTLATERPEDARSLIIVIQMVAEAVRYWEVAWRVLQNDSVLPNSRMIGLENNWGALSEQIQNSEVFAFQRPINIGGEVVDSVQSAIIKGMFLMLFKCLRPPSLEGIMHFVDPATEIMGRDGLCLDADRLQMVRYDLVEEDDTCKHLVDPRSRLEGRDGLCVEVGEFNYRDNNTVILAPCKSSDFRNQLWNFQSDGRIVSMEKCLAASGDSPGSTVMIHECDTLHESAVQWAMSNYGTLSNRYSGLVLTAASGTPKELTLESDTSSSFQAWQSTNTSAIDVYIRGENNQCIYYNGKYGVYTQGCRQGYSWHKWRLYPDSTIRPIEWLDGCLELSSLKYPSQEYNYIQAGYCNSDPERHRWVFTHKGSIMNLKSNLVVDSDKDYPEYLKAAPFQGGLNQIWMLEFI